MLCAIFAHWPSNRLWIFCRNVEPTSLYDEEGRRQEDVEKLIHLQMTRQE